MEYDTVDIFQAFADYVVLIPAEHADSLMRGLMHRAEQSRPVLDLFATVAEMVLTTLTHHYVTTSTTSPS